MKYLLVATVRGGMEENVVETRSGGTRLEDNIRSPQFMSETRLNKFGNLCADFRFGFRKLNSKFGDHKSETKFIC